MSSEEPVEPETSDDRPFPFLLHKLVSDSSCTCLQWDYQGLTFRLTDPEKFATEYMPKYFTSKIVLLLFRQQHASRVSS